MDNISKALLIAGGILFAILILTLLVGFYNQISTYYAEKNKSQIIEQITEFNNKFDNYTGQTIRGNELITVINKVVDYNRTYSDIDGEEKIIININLKGHQGEFLYTGTTSSDVIFNKSTITNVNGNDSDLDKIATLATTIVSDTGFSETQLQRLVADIANVCDNITDEYYIKTRTKNLQKILGYGKDKQFSNSEIAQIQSSAKKYYQFTQFKKAMFNCTEVVHSQNSGKINKISFEVVIENSKIKFD